VECTPDGQSYRVVVSTSAGRVKRLECPEGNMLDLGASAGAGFASGVRFRALHTFRALLVCVAVCVHGGL
jgi:hypothetical protein